MNKTALIIILIPFSVLSAFALWHHGYFGIWEPHFRSFGTGQVLADLGVALILILAWMYKDAKKKNRRFWPWAIATLTLGSFGPIFYLLSGKSDRI